MFDFGPDPRRGRFTISFNAMKHDRDLILQVMQGLIVIRCECRFDRQHFEYVATGVVFREVREGEVVPDYDLLWGENDHTEAFFIGFRERTNPNDVTHHPLIRPPVDGVQPGPAPNSGPGGSDGDYRGGSGIAGCGQGGSGGVPGGNSRVSGGGSAGQRWGAGTGPGVSDHRSRELQQGRPITVGGKRHQAGDGDQ
jgi:hypothetical protein